MLLDTQQKRDVEALFFLARYSFKTFNQDFPPNYGKMTKGKSQIGPSRPRFGPQGNQGTHDLNDVPLETP